MDELTRTQLQPVSEEGEVGLIKEADKREEPSLVEIPAIQGIEGASTVQPDPLAVGTGLSVGKPGFRKPGTLDRSQRRIKKNEKGKKIQDVLKGLTLTRANLKPMDVKLSGFNADEIKMLTNIQKRGNVSWTQKDAIKYMDLMKRAKPKTEQSEVSDVLILPEVTNIPFVEESEMQDDMDLVAEIVEQYGPDGDMQAAVIDVGKNIEDKAIAELKAKLAENKVRNIKMAEGKKTAIEKNKDSAKQLRTFIKEVRTIKTNLLNRTSRGKPIAILDNVKIKGTSVISPRMYNSVPIHSYLVTNNKDLNFIRYAFEGFISVINAAASFDLFWYQQVFNLAVTNSKLTVTAASGGTPYIRDSPYDVNNQVKYTILPTWYRWTTGRCCLNLNSAEVFFSRHISPLTTLPYSSPEDIPIEHVTINRNSIVGNGSHFYIPMSTAVSDTHYQSTNVLRLTDVTLIIRLTLENVTYYWLITQPDIKDLLSNNAPSDTYIEGSHLVTLDQFDASFNGTEFNFTNDIDADGSLLVPNQFGKTYYTQNKSKELGERYTFSDLFSSIGKGRDLNFAGRMRLKTVYNSIGTSIIKLRFDEAIPRVTELEFEFSNKSMMVEALQTELQVGNLILNPHSVWNWDLIHLKLFGLSTASEIVNALWVAVPEVRNAKWVTGHKNIVYIYLFYNYISIFATINKRGVGALKQLGRAFVDFIEELNALSFRTSAFSAGDFSNLNKVVLRLISKMEVYKLFGIGFVQILDNTVFKTAARLAAVDIYLMKSILIPYYNFFDLLETRNPDWFEPILTELKLFQASNESFIDAVFTKINTNNDPISFQSIIKSSIIDKATLNFQVLDSLLHLIEALVPLLSATIAPNAARVFLSRRVTLVVFDNNSELLRQLTEVNNASRGDTLEREIPKYLKMMVAGVPISVEKMTKYFDESIANATTDQTVAGVDKMRDINAFQSAKKTLLVQGTTAEALTKQIEADYLTLLDNYKKGDSKTKSYGALQATLNKFLDEASNPFLPPQQLPFQNLIGWAGFTMVFPDQVYKPLT